MGRQMKETVLQYGGLLIALALLTLVFSLQTDSFFQISTARLIANQIPELTLLAVGMTLVLIIGQIDLSVGSVMALAGAVLGLLMARHDWSLAAAMVAALATAAACGSVTGAISIWFRIPSFIVSLGMLQVARGATRRLLDSKTLTIGSDVAVISEPLPGIGDFARVSGGPRSCPGRTISDQQHRIWSLLCGDWHQCRSGSHVGDSHEALLDRRVCDQWIAVRVGRFGSHVADGSR